MDGRCYSLDLDLLMLCHGEHNGLSFGLLIAGFMTEGRLNC